MDISELTAAQIAELEKKIADRKRAMHVSERRIPRLRAKLEKLMAQVREVEKQIKDAEAGEVTVIRRRRRRTTARTTE